MTSCEFLNVAHAALVEEFMRPRVVRGITVSGLSLEEALETAAPWSEGFGTLPLLVSEDEQTSMANRERPAAGREKTEEEIVAQNNEALRWLEGRMSSVKGGFSTVKR